MARIDHYREPNAPVANSLVVAVSVFVVGAGEQLLMIRRTDNDLYSIPGGEQEIGETVGATAVREVKAETGVDVQVTGLIGVYSDPEHVITYDDGEVRQEFSLCFRAISLGGDLRTSHESKEVLWVDQPILPELTIHPSIRLRIQHGLDARSTPYFQ
jgi:ADP-ribose pyrophosphatase YjhB (NUDIX family)